MRRSAFAVLACPIGSSFPGAQHPAAQSSLLIRGNASDESRAALAGEIESPSIYDAMKDGRIVHAVPARTR
jgi:hypothetical protein